MKGNVRSSSKSLASRSRSNPLGSVSPRDVYESRGEVSSRYSQESGVAHSPLDVSSAARGNPRSRPGQPLQPIASTDYSMDYSGHPSNRDGNSVANSFGSPTFRSNGASRNGGFSGQDEPSTFSIVVATRIRPFNRKEVSDWLTEYRRKKASTAAANSLKQSVKYRERQPFGPGYNTLNDQLAHQNYAPNNAGGGSVNTKVFPEDENKLLLDVANGDEDDIPMPVIDVESDGKTLVLLDPQNPTKARGVFTFDYIFSSFAPSVEILGLMDNPMREGLGGTWELGGPAVPMVMGDEVEMDPQQEEQAEAEQVSIFQTLALPLLDSAMQGYNACIFAYGQTSSGKTYTMMGNKRHQGIIPRLCHELFMRIADEQGGDYSPTRGGTTSAPRVKVEVSYMEIYNEQVRDLLKQRPKNAILHYSSRFETKDIDHQEYQTLKVRQNPKKGLFVEGLTTVTANSWEECREYLRQGRALRTQCSTEMNETSSRSHAIFQMVVTQKEDMGTRVRGKNVSNDRVSKINLVDLAGSERNSSSQSVGKHLTEANCINVSLSTLRRVIDGLVSKKKGTTVIPYRESLLTYVLSDNFGGNSRTVMCANVSPFEANLSETESTLRYATLARGVQNRVKVNENPSAKVIRELKERMKGLQEELSHAPSAQLVSQLEHSISQSSAALEYMRTREAEMQESLNERLAREARLKNELRASRTKEDRWRRECDRQRRVNEVLQNLLLRVAKEHPGSVDLDLLEESMLGNDDVMSIASRSTANTTNHRYREPSAGVARRTSRQMSPKSASSHPKPARSPSKRSVTQRGAEEYTTSQSPVARSPSKRRPSVSDSDRMGRAPASQSRAGPSSALPPKVEEEPPVMSAAAASRTLKRLKGEVPPHVPRPLSLMDIRRDGGRDGMDSPPGTAPVVASEGGELSPLALLHSNQRYNSASRADVDDRLTNILGAAGKQPKKHHQLSKLERKRPEKLNTLVGEGRPSPRSASTSNAAPDHASHRPRRDDGSTYTTDAFLNAVTTLDSGRIGELDDDDLGDESIVMSTGRPL